MASNGQEHCTEHCTEHRDGQNQLQTHASGPQRISTATEGQTHLVIFAECHDQVLKQLHSKHNVIQTDDQRGVTATAGNQDCVQLKDGHLSAINIEDQTHTLLPRSTVNGDVQQIDLSPVAIDRFCTDNATIRVGGTYNVERENNGQDHMAEQVEDQVDDAMDAEELPAMRATKSDGHVLPVNAQRSIQNQLGVHCRVSRTDNDIGIQDSGQTTNAKKSAVPKKIKRQNSGQSTAAKKSGRLSKLQPESRVPFVMAAECPDLVTSCHDEQHVSACSSNQPILLSGNATGQLIIKVDDPSQAESCIPSIIAADEQHVAVCDIDEQTFLSSHAEGQLIVKVDGPQEGESCISSVIVAECPDLVTSSADEQHVAVRHSDQHFRTCSIGQVTITVDISRDAEAADDDQVMFLKRLDCPDILAPVCHFPGEQGDLDPAHDERQSGAHDGQEQIQAEVNCHDTTLDSVDQTIVDASTNNQDFLTSQTEIQNQYQPEGVCHDLVGQQNSSQDPCTHIVSQVETPLDITVVCRGDSSVDMPSACAAASEAHPQTVTKRNDSNGNETAKDELEQPKVNGDGQHDSTMDIVVEHPILIASASQANRHDSDVQHLLYAQHDRQRCIATSSHDLNGAKIPCDSPIQVSFKVDSSHLVRSFPAPDPSCGQDREESDNHQEPLLNDVDCQADDVKMKSQDHSSTSSKANSKEVCQIGSICRSEVIVRSLSSRPIDGLQRGVSFGTVMEGLCTHFSSNESGVNTYNLSFPTDKYDTFISHSWMTSRWKKYIAFLYHYSLIPAASMAFLVSLAACYLQVFFYLPVFGYTPLYPGGPPVMASTWCQILGGLTFFATLFLWDRAYALFEMITEQKKSFFVDKLCICQTDSSRKQRGIDALGVFIRNADEMFVLWSPEYFTRLWCCFELAIFLEASIRNKAVQKIHSTSCKASETPKNKLVIVPVACGMLCVYSSVLYFFFLLGGRLLQFVPIPWIQVNYDYTWAPVMVAGFVASGRLLRHYNHDRLQLHDQIKRFAVSKAVCTEQSDCQVLKQILTHLYSVNADMKEAISNFELLVHTLVKKEVEIHLGPVWQPPWQLRLVMFIFFWLSQLDYLAEVLAVDAVSHPERHEIIVKTIGRCFAIICSSMLSLHFSFASATLLQKQFSSLGSALDVAFTILLAAVSYPAVLIIPRLFFEFSMIGSLLSNIGWGTFCITLPLLCDKLLAWRRALIRASQDARTQNFMDEELAETWGKS